MLTAVHDAFNHPAARRVLLKLRYALFAAFLFALAHFAVPSQLLAGFLVSMFGELIQLWSFGALVKNEQLTARGPYVLVRNPMYLGRFFVVLGLVLLFDQPYLTFACAVAYAFYMVNRVRREERRLGGRLGEPYRRYCAEVNRFLPDLTRLTDPTVRFLRWDVLRRNHGHWNLLALLLAYAAVYLYPA